MRDFKGEEKGQEVSIELSVGVNFPLSDDDNHGYLISKVSESMCLYYAVPWKTASSSSSSELSELNRLSLMKTIKTMANIFIFLHFLLPSWSLHNFNIDILSDLNKRFNWIGVWYLIELFCPHLVHVVESEKVKLNSTILYCYVFSLICLSST